MKFKETFLQGIYIIEPKVFGDDRGYFFESYNMKLFEENLNELNFVQDNESKSSRGVLRGLHFQKPPFSQSKLVRCVYGKVLDVVVDIRVGSPTYGKHLSIELSGRNKKQLFVPIGFAHGYSVLSETAIFSYKVDKLYEPKSDSGIIYNDKDLNINWLLSNKEIKLSDKDKKLHFFKDLVSPFKF